jgi:predicted ATPase/class 3 adenylate cyclase
MIGVTLHRRPCDSRRAVRSGEHDSTSRDDAGAIDVVSSDVERPRGTVSFLFSDIEGSTRLWEQAPQQMARALDRHDELMRGAIEGAGGLVFKTVGDAFCACFSEAGAALEAAASAQRALAREPWTDSTAIRARIGVHSGACLERNGDYFGPTVNRVARLEAIAHGGQVVASRAAADLARPDLAPGLTLRSLGEHRLKDLEQPEEVFQLVIDGIPADFPPLRSLSNPGLKHNLPPQATSFVGWVNEIQRVLGLLGQSRLVTLTGAGGAGKTRLALQVAAEGLDGEDDGAWFVDLSPLRDERYVAATVAKALDVDEEAGRPIESSLADALARRKMLLVLDNCEHVVDSSASLVDGLLRACPGVHVLATSREPLGVAGEQVYRVPPLELPTDDHRTVLAQEVEAFESVQLLVQRAKAQDPSFEVDDATAPAIASICRRLEGIPLALELVAARLTMMSAGEIERRLDDRFRLLTGGKRSAGGRQQTLQASIDWSYDLLTGAERSVLRRLGVFVGPFDLHAAEAVCAGGDVDEADVVDLVAALVDQSLVVPSLRLGTGQLVLGESLREYAAMRLEEEGATTSTRDRHALHYVDVAVRHELPPDETIRPESLAAERDRLAPVTSSGDNYLAALRHALDAGLACDAVLRLAYCCAERCWSERQFAEGVDLLERAVERCAGEPQALLARDLIELGSFYAAQGVLADASTRLGEARGVAEAAARPDLVLKALGLLAFLGHRVDGVSSSDAVDEAMMVAEKDGSPDLLAYARYLRGTNSALASPAESLEDLRAAAAHFKARGMDHCFWDCVAELGLAELELGDLLGARRHFEEVLASDVGLEDAFRDTTHLNLAEISLQLGEVGDAVAHWMTGAAPIAESNKVGYFVPTVLIAALCCSASGLPREAARLHGAAEQLADVHAEQFEDVEAKLRSDDLDGLAIELGAGVLDEERGRGRLFSFHDAMALATGLLSNG